MTEVERQESGGPLQSDRGTTVISESVVSQLVGMAASEVEGVYMGGQASRTAGNFLGNITGSSGTTRGVSVEVGQVETAIDLTMGLEYGRNIVEISESVRRNIRSRVEGLTGLHVREMNITINDIVFPDDFPARGYSAEERAQESQASARTSSEDDTRPVQTAASEDETRSATPTSQASTRRTPAGDETAELKPPEEEDR